ncbi:dTDP-4-dehydrorhamnose reductase [Paenibacillus pasadenensis]|uniref:dTDP-4-dehydrorhamnose reductase n=1 Tax=Paenibacillus pasadenensis TaxID=217090 RepID=A0A2N5NDB7_9BACL|nr:dTDP-4-dehydrorhamnose reductase [Paenibacillus pasadenensis]PLT48323.1 dTDP-4-dehydrorhamnose reductase [Paenibacillus pasadenensis]
MNILVTGANGQLGKELALWQPEDGLNIVGLGRDELDITSLEQCRKAMEELKPDVVIHCAAYTAVDQAETDRDGAYRVNAAGTRNVALAAREAGAKLIYVSTDYVFDGQAERPYEEYDLPNPKTVYGKSKLAGEQLVQSLHDRWFIVRTSWVYGKHGANFVKTMLRLGAEKDRLSIVSDQFGSPTYTKDFAALLLELARSEAYGIYHASNTGSCSWHEFAQAIFEEAGLKAQADPCTTEEFPRPAPRPKFSIMDHGAIRVNGFNELPEWREALVRFLQELKA